MKGLFEIKKLVVLEKLEDVLHVFVNPRYFSLGGLESSQA